jgi:hypothetical protein
MAKTITMTARVAFDYRGSSLQPGQTFHPHNAAEAVALKTRKKADFTKATRARPTTSSVPVPQPIPTSRALETSDLVPGDDADEPVDETDTNTTDAPPSGRRGRGGRGRYNRQDMRAQS